MSDMLNRTNLQPRLVELIAGLRRHQVEAAVALLLDYVENVKLPQKGERTDAFTTRLVSMDFEADTVTFALPPGVRLGSGVYQIQPLRGPSA